MVRKRKNPSTELSTDTRELIARLVEPLNKRGVSRLMFCDCLAEADAVVPKASLDRWFTTTRSRALISHPRRRAARHRFWTRSSRMWRRVGC